MTGYTHRAEHSFTGNLMVFKILSGSRNYIKNHIIILHPKNADEHYYIYDDYRYNPARHTCPRFLANP